MHRSSRFVSRRQGVAAFSLIELMIVVGIMAIVLATGVPKMLRTMQKEGLRKAEADLLEACATARAQAIVHGIPMDLVIKAEDSSLTVQPAEGFTVRAGGAVEAGDGAPPPARAAERFASQLDDNIGIRELAVNFKSHMELPEARVRFFPNGTSDEFTILFFSHQGERMISLDLVTGLAKLEVIR